MKNEEEKYAIRGIEIGDFVNSLKIQEIALVLELISMRLRKS